MTKLLRAGVRRYVRSIVFYIALLATVVLAVLCGNTAKNIGFENDYVILEFVIIAILATWLIGREFDQRTFRNKIIAGHSKGSVFLSELILAVGSCMFLFLIFAGVFAAFNGFIFSLVPADVLIRIFFDCLFANIALAVLFATISCLISHRSVIAVITILLVFGMYGAPGRIGQKLSRE